jgi:hypothetical protein
MFEEKNIKADRHPAYNNVLIVTFFENLIYRSFYSREVRKLERTCECMYENEL